MARVFSAGRLPETTTSPLKALAKLALIIGLVIVVLSTFGMGIMNESSSRLHASETTPAAGVHTAFAASLSSDRRMYRPQGGRSAGEAQNQKKPGWAYKFKSLFFGSQRDEYQNLKQRFRRGPGASFLGQPAVFPFPQAPCTEYVSPTSLLLSSSQQERRSSSGDSRTAATAADDNHHFNRITVEEREGDGRGTARHGDPKQKPLPQVPTTTSDDDNPVVTFASANKRGVRFLDPPSIIVRDAPFSLRDPKNVSRYLCSPSSWIPDCLCGNHAKGIGFPGSLCGPDPSGAHRCSGSTCLIDWFLPIPTGFPRKYHYLENNNSRNNKTGSSSFRGDNLLVPWKRQVQQPRNEEEGEETRNGATTTSTILKKKSSVVSLIQLDPSKRRRHNGANLKLKCRTNSAQGFTNHELSLAQCILMAYQLNASEVFHVPFRKAVPITTAIVAAKNRRAIPPSSSLSETLPEAVSNLEDLYDLDYLNKMAEEYGMKVQTATSRSLPIPVVSEKKSVRKNNKRLEEEPSDSDRSKEKSTLDSGDDSSSSFSRCKLGNDVGPGNEIKFEWTAFAPQEVVAYADLGARLLNIDNDFNAAIDLLSSSKEVPFGWENRDRSPKVKTTCNEDTPILLDLVIAKYGSYNMYRVGQFLPTSDWLMRPSAVVREMVDAGKRSVIVEGMDSSAGYVGGGSRCLERMREQSVPVFKPRKQLLLRPHEGGKASPPPPSGVNDGAFTFEDDLPGLREFKRRVEAFRTPLSTSNNNSDSSHQGGEGQRRDIILDDGESVHCEYMAVHLRYEADARVSWKGIVGRMDHDKWKVLLEVDKLAETLKCRKVVLANKPISRRDYNFLIPAWAQYYVTGIGRNEQDNHHPASGPMIVDDGVVGVIPKAGRQVLQQMAADRQFITEASVAVIWDPFSGVSSFSQRIYDLRCREKESSQDSPPQLTFSYSMPFNGALTPEC